QHELLQQRIIALEKKLDPAEQPLKVDRWSVAEALYLINIAEHHYSLERNATMATSALTQARQQLIKHHSDAFNPAIKQLSLAINQLKDSDREEYKQQASQLSQLSILIPDLPITHHTFVIQNSPASKDYSLQSIDGWRQYGSSLWHDLQQLFRIHRPTNLSRTEGQPITTDIHPILRQQLALKVELAKITLLSRSPLYLDTLKEIIAILNQYFDGDAEMVKSEIGRLEQMVAVAEHDLPKINFDAIRQQLPPEGN
ncbi:MAG: uroporphyrinogen-III C-methyltransferase, partial [Chromatiales bacterium]|nr:uroporphyrinogen-III C-methyltransferase [Chromatiales bacterium]